jgi:cation diffusion facilitator family transporter
MHTRTLEKWKHDHDFTLIQEKGEKRAVQVLLLTAATMIAEIVAGNLFGSMALLADGWHMATHVAAFAISIAAYRYARRHAGSPGFSFGTGKVSVLGGFASAVALAVVALMMVLESVERFFSPQAIRFNEAIAVAILGLVINLICALILQDNHGHDERDAGARHDDHHDHNLRAAYMHVVADALTSVLAIVALFSGKYLGLAFMDPAMGIVGAAVITRWSLGLARDTGSILLDQSIDEDRKSRIKETLERDSDNRVADMHIWKVGPADYAVIVSLVTDCRKQPEHYKGLLAPFSELSHITIEVNQCEERPCADATACTPDG